VDDRIAIICPSRNRNNLLKTCVNSWKANTAGFSDFYVILDDDNEINYDRIEGINYLVYPRTAASDCFNKPIKHLLKSYTYLMCINDDMVIQTSNWEIPMLEAAKEFNYWGVVSADDMAEHDPALERPLSIPMLGYKLVKFLGWINYPKLLNGYGDIVLRDLLNVAYLKKIVTGVKIKHNHWMYNKDTQMDETYRVSKENNHKDYLTWQEFIHSQEFKDLQHRLVEVVAEDM
jgi:hypothetical protein